MRLKRRKFYVVALLAIIACLISFAFGYGVEFSLILFLIFIFAVSAWAIYRLRSTIGFLLALVLVITILFSIGNSIREEILFRLLDYGWPQIKAGDPGVEVMAMIWKDDVRYWKILEPGERGFYLSEPEFKLFVDTRDEKFPPARSRETDVYVSFPYKSIAGYDSRCGRACRMQIFIEGLKCSNLDCELHMWEKENGDRKCFFKLSEQLRDSLEIAKFSYREEKPDPYWEFAMECPKEIGWKPLAPDLFYWIKDQVLDY